MFVRAQNSVPSVARGRVVGLVRLIYILTLRLSFAGFLGTGVACLVPLALGPVVWHLKSPLTSIAVPVKPLLPAVRTLDLELSRRAQGIGGRTREVGDEGCIVR